MWTTPRNVPGSERSKLLLSADNRRRLNAAYPSENRSERKISVDRSMSRVRREPGRDMSKTASLRGASAGSDGLDSNYEYGPLFQSGLGVGMG